MIVWCYATDGFTADHEIYGFCTQGKRNQCEGKEVCLIGVNLFTLYSDETKKHFKNCHKIKVTSERVEKLLDITKIKMIFNTTIDSKKVTQDTHDACKALHAMEAEGLKISKHLDKLWEDVTELCEVAEEHKKTK